MQKRRSVPELCLTGCDNVIRSEGPGHYQASGSAWLVIVRIKGSHRQYKHPVKVGLVTVPGHLSDELHPKTLNSILAQAGLKGGM
jgi:predicted RNA binding protein YcfA (HicA-like mRNA interferase family)